MPIVEVVFQADSGMTSKQERADVGLQLRRTDAADAEDAVLREAVDHCLEMARRERHRVLERSVHERAEILSGTQTRHGLGFYLLSGHHVIPGPNIIYGGGRGGSLVVIDFDARAVCSYAMNRMVLGPHIRGMALTTAFWNVLANR